MNIERHHVEPVSLNGLNLDCNILPLKRWTHKELHQTLDIDRKTYSKTVRKMRELYNHKLIQSPDELERRADIQRLFFDNIGDLPDWLVQKHVLKMMEMYDFHNEQYKDISWYYFDKPKRLANRVDQFFELHTLKTEIRKEIAQTFIDTVRVQHYQV